MAALLVGHLHYDWDQPHLAANDHLIFSKGHASPLLYSMFRAVGVVSEEVLIDTYRQLGARLEGHPTPGLPWVDVATGSLGQGLPGDRRTHDRGRGPLPRGRDRQRRTAGPGHRIGAGAATRAPCRAGAAHLGHPGGTSRRGRHLRSPHRRLPPAAWSRPDQSNVSTDKSNSWPSYSPTCKRCGPARASRSTRAPSRRPTEPTWTGYARTGGAGHRDRLRAAL